MTGNWAELLCVEKMNCLVRVLGKRSHFSPSGVGRQKVITKWVKDWVDLCRHPISILWSMILRDKWISPVKCFSNVHWKWVTRLIAECAGCFLMCKLNEKVSWCIRKSFFLFTVGYSQFYNFLMFTLIIGGEWKPFSVLDNELSNNL